jgi:Xaa-Pro dipeptidase
MAEAGRMIDASLAGLLPRIKPGLTERQVAAFWLEEMFKVGSEGASFDAIVAAGPDSAFPHHATSNRKLQAGDLVILDGGCRFGGYASDITRTICLGKPNDQQRRIYEVVQAANAAGRAAARVGVTGAQVDAAARKVITDAGYAQYFPHRTGHGLGLDVHEEPYIAGTNTRPLEAGNVFTIEPGVYIENVGGVRIEDDVVLTGDGAKTLTNAPRELAVLPLS